MVGNNNLPTSVTPPGSSLTPTIGVGFSRIGVVGNTVAFPYQTKHGATAAVSRFTPMVMVFANEFNVWTSAVVIGPTYRVASPASGPSAAIGTSSSSGPCAGDSADDDLRYRPNEGTNVFDTPGPEFSYAQY